uniref:Uncharacterized protein n=1 Tax=uncultured prokaryote TaxID=198431 RepID=A0A0H5Q549_9ZZZZ|nr:hypothetical protein [uncultured prokaryote]
MKYPMTASVILVQLDADSDVVAYVAYQAEGGEEKTTRVELKLGNLPDASDTDMWMQMATASVCDAL